MPATSTLSRIPLVRGRLFGSQDGPGSPRVFVISQQTARALYLDDDLIGRRLPVENGLIGEVVGVRRRRADEDPGLLMGIIGIYGVMSYLVSQRMWEVAIRIALGARPSALPFTVITQGLGYTAAGVALGLAGAFFVSDRLGPLLFQVDGRDPLTFAGVAVLVAVVTVLSAFGPARRAATTDPLIVLRAE